QGQCGGQPVDLAATAQQRRHQGQGLLRHGAPRPVPPTAPARSRSAPRGSAALTLLAIGLGLYQAVQGIGWRYFAAAMLAIAMLGLWQKYWALRVALDAELFERFSRAGDRLEAQSQDLDRALADLGLARSDAAGRTWNQRSRGA
ncbi:hypothetical protein ACV33M_32220, partial [Pseudomonas aeruginosa]